jgi:hypothetical protein
MFLISSPIWSLYDALEREGRSREKGSNLPRTEEKPDEVRLGSAERGEKR